MSLVIFAGRTAALLERTVITPLTSGITSGHRAEEGALSDITLFSHVGRRCCHSNAIKQPSSSVKRFVKNPKD